MDDFLTPVLYAALAGAMIPLGGAIGHVERISPLWLEREFRHSVIAFGGGVLLAAISFVLVPEGVSHLDTAWVIPTLLAGGIAFALLDRAIAAREGSVAQLIAMVADFFPEAIALGAMFAAGNPAATLLAVLIGLQNLPEGFNAYRELRAVGRHSPRRILQFFTALALLGPFAAAFGQGYLADLPTATAALMLFAAGGILYLIFQDIAPAAHLERQWAPSLGAVGGFSLGLLGHLLVA